MSVFPPRLVQPERIISGRITPPQFELDNKKLITKHINSIVIQVISDYYRIDKLPKEIYKVEEVKEMKFGVPEFIGTKVLEISGITSVGGAKKKGLK